MNMTSHKSGNDLVFVLGGARSGKSSWARKHAESRYDSYLFLATARILDEEMAERVRLHKASRGPQWQLIEEPLEIADVLRTGCNGVGTVLVDCLTVWMSNVLLEKGEEEVVRYQDDLLNALETRTGSVILVSNEVGMGVVPETPLGRGFRDHAGRLNQRVAAVADTVVFLVAGLPWHLKGNPECGGA